MLVLLTPLRIALSIVVIVVGFQLTFAGAGFVVLFAMLGTVMAMPFLFMTFAWDDRGSEDERRRRRHREMWGLTPDESDEAHQRSLRGETELTWEQRRDKGLLTPWEQHEVERGYEAVVRAKLYRQARMAYDQMMGKQVFVRDYDSYTVPKPT